MNMNKMVDTNEMVESLKRIFSRDKRIIASYLFGSLSKGNFHKGSDIDLGIALEPSKVKDFSLDDQLNLEIELTLALKTENYDLIIINHAPLILQFRIISQGKLIFVEDDEARCNLEERIMSLYYDFLYRLNEFNKEYFSALQERYLK